jgi:hypothetical protein
MIPQQFYYQLVVLGLVWLFGMLCWAWPSACIAGRQRPPTRLAGQGWWFIWYVANTCRMPGRPHPASRRYSQATSDTMSDVRGHGVTDLDRVSERSRVLGRGMGPMACPLLPSSPGIAVSSHRPWAALCWRAGHGWGTCHARVRVV